MKIAIWLLFAISIVWSESWLKTTFGISAIHKMQVFKDDYIECEKGGKEVYCKATLDSDQINLLCNGQYIITDSIYGLLTGYFRDIWGFILVNDSFTINTMNSFLYPCTLPVKLVYLRTEVHGQWVQAAVAIKNKCNILSKIDWYEITKTEYFKMNEIHKYTKPSYKSQIDSMFTEKNKYKLGKIIGSEETGNCAEDYLRKRIRK